MIANCKQMLNRQHKLCVKAIHILAGRVELIQPDQLLCGQPVRKRKMEMNTDS